MSNQRCDVVNWLLWPLTLCATVSLLLPHYEVAAFYGMTLFTIGAHIHYGTCVVSSTENYVVYVYTLDCTVDWFKQSPRPLSTWTTHLVCGFVPYLKQTLSTSLCLFRVSL